MNNQKLQNIFGCLGLLLLGLIVLCIMGLSFGFVPPLSTWGHSLRVVMADRNTVEGDSLYLACLREKADLLEKKGDNKRALKTRKQIVHYFEEKGDSVSVDYVLELFNCYKLDSEGTNINLKTARDILWNAWENGKLEDSQKKELYYILIFDISPGAFIQPNDEPIYQQMLDVAQSIKEYDLKQDLITCPICCLLTIYMRDMRHVDKITQYIPLLLESQGKAKEFQFYRWVILTRYYLFTHNTIEAQTCLNAAKALKLRDRETTITITRLQRAIYEANGENQKEITEERHLIALDSSVIERHLLRWEIAIDLSRKFQAKYYEILVERDAKNIIEAYQQKDSLTFDEKWTFTKYRTKIFLLYTKFFLKFINENPTPFLNAAAETISSSPEEQLNFINLSIQTSLKYPSDSSVILLQNSLNALKMRLQYTFPHFTDGEKASFWLSEEPILRQIYADNSSTSVKYNTALLSKGLLLSSSNNVRRSILESKDSLLINDWNQLQMLRQAELLSTESSPQDMHTIHNKADSLERSVTQRSQAYQHLQNTWDITWENVQDKLIDGECAIEIVHYPIKNDVQYDALIIRKQDSVPTCVHIGRESAYKVGAASIFNQRSPLIDTIWAPIRPYLSNGNIYISMDGIFHHLNIEAMMVDKNGNLLSDLYSIVRVSSTRDLVQSVSMNIKNAALYGGVDYGKSDVSGSKDLPRATAPEEIERGFIFADRKRKDFSVNSLPFTLVEVNGIDSLLKSQGCETKLYVKQMATESAFKAMSGDSIRVLHISTHGIANQLSDGNADPMRYCCLLLAGANNTLSKNKPTAGDQDGLLTASEISSLDFRGTDLVVLSACNTAGGEVTADGVFGLQRAFKQAGAQSILMSLSGINDAITAEFMREYYQQIVEENDKRSALTRTRNIIRRKYPSSMDWASFILLD